ncbi:MAG: SdpI family protein [Anaerolineales bacterium]|nr:SdpI family protein [Anaerolineales bacterium]
METLLYMYVGGGLFLALIALPLLAEKVKPNPFYGFRVSQTLDDPRIWYATNKYFAQRLLVVGLVEALAAFGLFFWPGLTLDGYALACLGVFVVLFIPAIVQSWRYMKTL